jgi:hypothetical protein
LSVKVVTVVKDDLFGLKRTEHSIREQSNIVSWVLVTPNDGSQTHEYAQQLKSAGIAKAIIPDQGSGVYAAMNQAVAEITEGEWLWFLNAGDEFATVNTYQLVSKYAQDSINSWIYGGHYLGSKDGKILGEVKTPSQFRISNQLFAKKYVSHQSTIFRAKFLRDLGGFQNHLKIAADWDLMVRASLVDPGLRIPEILSTFYMGGLSTESRQQGNRELFQIRKLYLGRKYTLKNYWWFGYRWIRNGIVQNLEGVSIQLTDRIRTIRLSIRNFTRR